MSSTPPINWSLYFDPNDIEYVSSTPSTRNTETARVRAKALRNPGEVYTLEYPFDLFGEEVASKRARSAARAIAHGSGPKNMWRKAAREHNGTWESALARKDDRYIVGVVFRRNRP